MRCFATRASLTACLQPASFLLSGVHIAFSERRFRIARPSALFRSSLRACDSVPSGASAFFFHSARSLFGRAQNCRAVLFSPWLRCRISRADA